MPTPCFNFNPTLVQLEWMVWWMDGMALSIFQSHIGAIRIRENCNSVQFDSKFQSHIGAIRIRTPLSSTNPSYPLFQSHIGAIRMQAHQESSWNACLISIPHWCNQNYTKFQTICQERANFNPTLVQLESFLSTKPKPLYFSFQSHIGAIRIVVDAEEFDICASFQSHIGAIRMQKHSCLLGQTIPHFNPTLVQLELKR